MAQPPFRPALLSSAATWVAERHVPVDDGEPCCQAGPGSRTRLGELNPHLHCSVVGTCLGTAELRKLVARFVHVEGLNDLEVHHEAVRLAAHNGELARTLHRALDRRHEAALTRFARAKDETALGQLWDEALRNGEVPGAYWAVLTHRRTTPELRQRVFGDVHMLSHLVGAANRADIRRLVALEKDNAELRERAERQQERLAEAGAEREREALQRQALQAQLLELQTAAQQQRQRSHAADALLAEQATLASSVALQALRREQAESAQLAAEAEARRLAQELARLQQQTQELARELQAAETQLREMLGSTSPGSAPLRELLAGRRLLYVGGRPSSTPAIRDLVQRHGGEFQRHDGGIEDRKGLLAPALAWASLVVFPVDCVDHDSALALKRHCIQQGRPFLALRSASVASFAAGLVALNDKTPGGGDNTTLCLRHA